MSQDNIADPNKPSAGRMYDYMLGGTHNFEIDRQAAEQVMQLMPFSRKFLRLQRWALQDIAVELSTKRGFDVIIDFASGLPTNDNIHHKVAPGVKVIYSDYDPVVAEYAIKILDNTPNVYFFQGDARHPETLLERQEVQEILDGKRKVAFVHWGVSSFLADEEIMHVAKFLYDWAAPGSCWAFNAQGAGMPDTPASEKVRAIYSQTGVKTYKRSLERFEELIQPWKIDGDGFTSLLEWHGFEQSELADEDVEVFGPMGGGYGVYLIK